MTCATARDLASAYVDGELPPEQATELAVHLTSCRACAAEHEAMVTTVRTLHEGLVRFRAPDVLRARVRAAIRGDRAPDTRAARPVWRLPWRAVAVGILIAATSSTLTVAATRGDSARGSPVANEVVASHIRSLMPDHLTDVHSSDQHNVKPWFNGRLDYSPAVPRLDSAGFPLLGGRLDYVDSRPVAVVVYGRRQHVINVFSWPIDVGPAAPVSALQTRHGYNVLQRTRAGVQYWVVSDLNQEELRLFAEMLLRN